MNGGVYPFYLVKGKTLRAMPLLLLALATGCASTPQEREAEEKRREEQRQGEEQRRAAGLRRKAEQEQKHWQEVLAPYSDEQLRFKLEGLEQAIARGKEGMNILLRQGNGIGVLIAQGQIEVKVKERDAVGLELARRTGSPGAVQPRRSRDGTAGRWMRSGSGFFITTNGYFVTCEHVIADASNIVLEAKGGNLPARLIRWDKANDLAVLKVEGVFTPLPVASSGHVKLGENVFTIGFPDPDMQGVEPKLTRGEISSLTGMQDDPREFQISVSVQPGNSGGPLVDLYGNVVGVVEARLADVATFKRTGSLPQNVNYAVKSSAVKVMLESLPEVSANLKEPSVKQRDFQDIVKDTTTATTRVLGY